MTFVVDPDGHDLPICLVGDFTEWDAHALPLEPTDDGHLALTVELPMRASHAFRYRDASRRWFNDGEADHYCANEWGGLNGVVLT